MMGLSTRPPTPSNDAITALLQLFEIVSNPTKHKALIDELTRARDEAHEAMSELSDLQAKHAAADAAREGYESMIAAAKERIAGFEAKLAADRAAHQAAVDEHARTVEAHKAAVAAFEKDKARHAARLDELERVRQSLAA
jgi:hypothetical protein